MTNFMRGTEMRFLLIAVAFMMVLSASNVFAMGKSDGDKAKVEKPLVKNVTSQEMGMIANCL